MTMRVSSKIRDGEAQSALPLREPRTYLDRAIDPYTAQSLSH